MIITNQKQAVNLRIRKSIALLGLIISIGLIYFANILPHSTFGLSRNEIAILIFTMFLLFFIFHFIRNHNYIYFSDTGNKLILRYFSLRPLEDKKNSIEISKNQLYKYEIKRSMLGLNKSVILYSRTPGGIAKYPPVSITALTNSDERKILESLQRNIPANRKVD